MAGGKFVWPGFRQNMRVLKWIVERCRDRAHGVETALGLQPEYRDLDWRGMDFSSERFGQVLRYSATTPIGRLGARKSPSAILSCRLFRWL